MVLLEMEKTIEAYLGEVVNAMITILVYFNSNQRQAIINANKIAGFNMMCIISEPMSAAPFYGLDKTTSKHHSMLVFVLDGGNLMCPCWE